MRSNCSSVLLMVCLFLVDGVEFRVGDGFDHIDDVVAHFFAFHNHVHVQHAGGIRIFAIVHVEHVLGFQLVAEIVDFVFEVLFTSVILIGVDSSATIICAMALSTRLNINSILSFTSLVNFALLS